MKSLTKQQLADYAGVSVKTLMRWCHPYMEELQGMGLESRTKVLNPNVVRFMTEKFSIDLPP